MPRSVAQRFPRADGAVPEARSFLGGVLEEWKVTDRSDDAVLCLSELATNAVRHGAHGGFLVKVSLDDGRLRVGVHDAGAGAPGLARPSDDDTDGRGLLIVSSLADGWGVTPHNSCGKTVWTEFKTDENTTRADVIRC
ncbi:ATP-binding protein [Streptomyces sp. HNM0663]|uniref:ATP-binding protein n=1 Tax=Streptomyces chengmaiensis TaxID=3040919 RepID=A0ABT6HFV0_9ACTN|nr:ATP-binding protein [Streptomyces chengmaiensis]MDH2387645.1 ATP-binding protein [Streptomyces chengmaiensis]